MHHLYREVSPVHRKIRFECKIIFRPNEIDDLLPKMVDIDDNFIKTLQLSISQSHARAKVCSLPNQCLSIVSVNGLNRVPKPAAKIIAFMI